MSRPTQDQIDERADFIRALKAADNWVSSREEEFLFMADDLKAARDELAQLRSGRVLPDVPNIANEVAVLRTELSRGFPAVALTAALVNALLAEHEENAAMAALLEDHDLSACWDSARDGSDPTPPECDGGWDENGNMVSEVCWEHRRRATLAARAKRMGGGT